jgi:hypothetical protein
MSASQHRHDDPNASGNEKNRMSENPRDGARGPYSKAKAGEDPTNQIPEGQRQDPSPIDTFAEEGAGIAAKE